MTKPQVVKNIYCLDPEDRVVRGKCAACEQCWIFVASKDNKKNGRCPFAGPFEGTK